jgi:hypothetical protein
VLLVTILLLEPVACAVGAGETDLLARALVLVLDPDDDPPLLLLKGGRGGVGVGTVDGAAACVVP